MYAENQEHSDKAIPDCYKNEYGDNKIPAIKDVQ